MKYAVTGMPRSRTKWASTFLSIPDCPCLHDVPPPQVMSVDANCGISDPSVLYNWRYIPENIPLVYIQRSLSEVEKSLRSHDIPPFLIHELYERALDMVRERQVLVLDFDNLDAHRLWQYCHGTEISDEYVKVYTDMNITQQAVEELRRVG